MNNEKRIILAIALYAAVITMVLHTLDSDGHQRFTTPKQSEQFKIATMPPAHAILCIEDNCFEPETQINMSNNTGTSEIYHFQSVEGSAKEEKSPS
jgi:hypothetical protein